MTYQQSLYVFLMICWGSSVEGGWSRWVGLMEGVGLHSWWGRFWGSELV